MAKSYEPFSGLSKKSAFFIQNGVEWFFNLPKINQVSTSLSMKIDFINRAIDKPIFIYVKNGIIFS